MANTTRLNIDFITCHQYLWFEGSTTEGYDAWKNYGNDLIPNITKNLDYVYASSKPNLEIFVTETGVTGGKYPDPQVFNHRIPRGSASGSEES
jgi:hypothetical protein